MELLMNEKKYIFSWITYATQANTTITGTTTSSTINQSINQSNFICTAPFVEVSAIQSADNTTIQTSTVKQFEINLHKIINKTETID